MEQIKEYRQRRDIPFKITESIWVKGSTVFLNGQQVVHFDTVEEAEIFGEALKLGISIGKAKMIDVFLRLVESNNGLDKEQLDNILEKYTESTTH